MQTTWKLNLNKRSPHITIFLRSVFLCLELEFDWYLATASGTAGRGGSWREIRPKNRRPDYKIVKGRMKYGRKFCLSSQTFKPIVWQRWITFPHPTNDHPTKCAFRESFFSALSFYLWVKLDSTLVEYLAMLYEIGKLLLALLANFRIGWK